MGIYFISSYLYFDFDDKVYAEGMNPPQIPQLIAW